MTTKLTITIPVWLDKFCAWPVMAYRKHKYGYTYRRISLGEGKFTIVEPEDYYRFNLFNWCPREQGPNIYAVRPIYNPYRTAFVSLHREIMGNPRGLVVDHKNNKGLDNRRENLRPATRSQNNCNTTKRKNTSSRFLGVSFDKRSKRWAAYINHDGKRIFLGYFDSEIDAARAYDAAARIYHGEFARLNFPEEAPVS